MIKPILLTTEEELEALLERARREGWQRLVLTLPYLLRLHQPGVMWCIR